ncbi:c-type cytochrome, partial [candidate division KSB1 bacterium]
SKIMQYVKLHSKFFALLTLVFGAISGVGIWFTIGLINPAATSSLIHTFVWAWAIEWVFFLVEVVAAIVYYNTWGRVSQKNHFIIGWIYFIMAFLSLVVINGILTFMLTPNVWLETKSIWEGYFNVTFLPSLFTRTSICIALAGIYALVTASFLKDKETGRKLIRYAGIWVLTGTVFAIPSVIWYYTNLPLDLTEILSKRLPTTWNASLALTISGGLLLVLALIPVIVPKYFHKSMAFVLGIIALTAFGSFEFVRESARKPYVIYGYMYVNSLRPEEYPMIRDKGGILKYANWVENKDVTSKLEAGRDIFRVACRNCHSINGYKGLKKTLNGLNKEFIAEVIQRLELLRGKMPPFPGIPDEREALAEYLHSITDQNYKISTGEEVFKKRCNICHTQAGEFRGLTQLLNVHDQESLLKRIPTLGSMQKKMAPWSGTDEEARMLAEYISTWYFGNSQTQERR